MMLKNPDGFLFENFLKLRSVMVKISRDVGENHQKPPALMTVQTTAF